MTIARALITGGSGQLGSDLGELLSSTAEVARLDHAALDITDDGAVATAIEDARPDVVFNCAAFHNVEECECEEDTAAEVNVRAVKRLAERCSESGAKLVHFSTNYVFDGEAGEPYTEQSLPNPQSIYALTKLAGEYAALAYDPRALVIRGAGLYGLAGSATKGGNFVERMAARALAGEAITMVSDQRLSPTFTSDLAAAVVAAVDAEATGVVHLTAQGECSWYEFTLGIVEALGLDSEVNPVETTRPPGGAARPKNGVLANAAAEEMGLAPLRDWREALFDYVERADLGAPA